MKKRLLSALLTLAMLISSAALFSVSASTAGIDWTQNTITLNTAQEFSEFHEKIVAGEKFVGKTVKLGADIDMSGITVNKVPGSSVGFQGTFDGQFHTISNIGSSSSYATLEGGRGLFGSVDSNNTAPVVIKNFSIENSYFNAWGNSGVLFGNVWNDLVVENVCIKATVKNSHDQATAYVGGFVGRIGSIGQKASDISFTNCVFDGAMTHVFTRWTEYNTICPFVALLDNTVNTEDSTKTYEAVGTLSFTNCLAAGTTKLKNGATNWLGGIKFVCRANSTKMTISYTSCVQFNDYYQSNPDQAVSPECAGIGEGRSAIAPTGYSVRSEGYPVPTTLLCFFEAITDNVAKYVFFRHGTTLIDTKEITGGSLKVEKFPEISGTSADNVVWTNADTGAIVEAPYTFTEETILVAKVVGMNDSVFLGAQLSTVTDGKFNMRLIGGIFSLDGTGAGLDVTIKYKTAGGDIVERKYQKDLSTVYKAINATENGEIKNVTANELGAKYLYAFVIEDIPTDAGQLDVTVTPYKVVNTSGRHVPSSNATKTFSIKDGVIDTTLAPLS